MASYRQDWASYIMKRAPYYGVDPRAALAVARSEGLSGAVGDNGTSFGPFQLHVGGALPSGRGRTWAESNAGIDYALSRIGSVSKGLKGNAAINAIVRHFERPADPDSEVQRAIGYYGGKLTGTPTKGKPFTPPAQSQTFQATDDDARQQALLSFVMANNASFASTGRVDPGASLGTLAAAFAAGGASPVAKQPGEVTPEVNPGTTVSKGKALPWQKMVASIKHAQAMGLRVSENPFVDKVDPVHTKTSYHYRTFGGNHGVGRAADISGDPAKMSAFSKWFLGNYGGGSELFYDPLGGWKFGKSIGAIGGHGDHVHIAF